MVPEADLDAVGIFRTLNRQGVDFVVVGGYAAAAHGVIRATDDLDLVVDRGWENAGRLGRALKELDAQDATGAHTPLTAEVLARREDRLFNTSLGRIHLLRRSGPFRGTRSWRPRQPSRSRANAYTWPPSVTWPGGADLAPDTLYERVRTGTWPDQNLAA